MKKVKLFTHTDLDGVGCAIVAMKVLGVKCVDVEFVDYKNVDSKILSWLDSYKSDMYNGQCFITDISVSEETAMVLNETDLDLCLLDHHPTAIGLNKYNWCEVRTIDRFGNKISGTDMLYDYFLEPAPENLRHPAAENLRQFVRAVTLYDTWEWTKNPNGKFSKDLNDLLHLYGRTFFISHVLNGLNEGNFREDFLTEKDKFVLFMEQRKIDGEIFDKNNQMVSMPLLGYRAGIVFAENHISEIGNELCRLNPEIDFVVLINLANKTISFRTIKDIDVGKDVASKLGGGGHPKAAGATISKDTERVLLATLFGEMTREVENG